jgi:type IV secretion system protein VirB10
MTASQEHRDEPNLDDGLGLQPDDINSVGAKHSGMPRRLLVGIVLLLVVLVLLGAMAVKYLLLPRMAEFVNPAPRQVAVDKPVKGTAVLPGNSTPLGIPEPPPEAPQADGAQSNPQRISTGWEAGTKSGNRSSQNPSTRSSASEGSGKTADCPVKEVIDRRTGLAVKDAQGRILKVDCQGNLQDGNSGGAIQVVPAPTRSGGQGPVAEKETDRYGGDSTLSTTKKPQAQSAGMGGISGLPGLSGMPAGTFPTASSTPPSPSSVMMDAFLKSMAKPAGSAGVNSSLASNSAFPSGNSANATNGPNTQGSVGGMLNPTSTPKALAVRSINPSLTIAKGDSIDCAMTTRVVTEISGFTSCQITSNVYSSDGKVLLIERMSEVEGEYAAVGSPGQRRVYVLWSRIRKPGGVTIDIASPSTDQLGAAGIDGIVDNRWFERIGSAYMLSLFKDFVTAAATPSGTNGTVVLQNSIQTSNNLAEKVLSQSINIKPVVYANQGDRVAIYVARDLDFSNVYSVKAVK